MNELNRNRVGPEFGMSNFVHFPCFMMLCCFVCFLLVVCGTTGAMSKPIGSESKTCNQNDKTLIHLDREGSDAQFSSLIESFLHATQDPIAWKAANERKKYKRSQDTDNGSKRRFSHPEGGIVYGSGDENMFKNLFLHLIKYPPRPNRAETKSEDYHLRASYIPRLGRKRSGQAENP